MRDAVGWGSRILVLAASLAIAGSLTLGLGIGPWRLVTFLGQHASPVHAAVVGWLIVAPLFLVLAAAARLRTPWPWVGASTLFLLALTVAFARFPHLFSPGARLLLAVLVLATLASVVTVFTDTEEVQSP
ncbi:MAG: hypothetical protein L0H31_06660 [Nocardioidaceae bacterium]|nr:hypothetical protein [Nocardioidaceae bacterium]